MRAVYLDNCAAAFPKAPGVGEAMCRAVLRPDTPETGPEAVGETLLALANAPAGSLLRFTPGLDWGLERLLSGLLQPGDKILASPMGRGSTLRLLSGLPGITVELLPCTDRGELKLDGLAEKLAAPVRAVVLSHACPVCGTVQPLEAVGLLCRERGILFLVDAGQTLGVLPVDLAAQAIDGLAFWGHTGLLGPEGVSGLALSPRLTGAADLLETEEPANLPGIAGLGAALNYLAEMGAPLRTRLEQLSRHLWARLMELDGAGLRVLGSPTPRGRPGVVSVVCTARPNAELARLLEGRYGIRCAWGLLGSPLACRTLGCGEQGVVRFSVGPFTTFGQIDYLEGALETLL